MRAEGLGGVGVRLGSGALALALDRLGSPLAGGHRYCWSAWTAAVGRSLVGAVIRYGSMMGCACRCGENLEEKKHT